MLATKGHAMMRKVRRGRGPWRAVLAVCLAIGLGAALWFAPLSFGGTYRVSAAQLHEAATTARGLLLIAQGADGAGAALTWAAMSRAEIGGAIPIYQVGESGNIVLDKAAYYPVYVDGRPTFLMYKQSGKTPAPRVEGGNPSVGAPSFEEASALSGGGPWAMVYFAGDLSGNARSGLYAPADLPEEMRGKVMMSDSWIRVPLN